MRIGVMKEGFGHPNSEPDVDAKVRDAAQRFAKLGAIVEEVSVPEHRRSAFRCGRRSAATPPASRCWK